MYYYDMIRITYCLESVHCVLILRSIFFPDVRFSRVKEQCVIVSNFNVLQPILMLSHTFSLNVFVCMCYNFKVSLGKVMHRCTCSRHKDTLNTILFYYYSRLFFINVIEHFCISFSRPGCTSPSTLT